MSGFTIQQTPMVGGDGTVYLNRTQNNAATDFFYAFTDTGTAFLQRWSVASQWTTNSEFAEGKDGSVYMLRPGEILTALDPATGAVRASYPTPLGAANPRIAVDAMAGCWSRTAASPTVGLLVQPRPDVALVGGGHQHQHRRAGAGCRRHLGGRGRRW